jgi:hypothetical protein
MSSAEAKRKNGLTTVLIFEKAQQKLKADARNGTRKRAGVHENLNKHLSTTLVN